VLANAVFFGRPRRRAGRRVGHGLVAIPYAQGAARVRLLAGAAALLAVHAA
jgi:hypothetical protein